jgi:hypothetical protein
LTKRNDPTQELQRLLAWLSHPVELSEQARGVHNQEKVQ